MRTAASVAVLLLGGLAAGPAPAESFQSCTGMITSLPAVISTQGVWCMTQDLATAISTGTAIRAATNNVTIDCNDYKVSGLAAGPSTQATGIGAIGRGNVTVRNCNVRGFRVGIGLVDEGSYGHAVLDNRLDGNTFHGIFVEADASVVRGNRILDTGGSTSTPGEAHGIRTIGDVDIDDNLVDGVAAVAVGDSAGGSGIRATENDHGAIEGNRVRGVTATGQASYGIRIGASTGVKIGHNAVSEADTGIFCGTAGNLAYFNTLSAVGTAVAGCISESNLVVP